MMARVGDSSLAQLGFLAVLEDGLSEDSLASAALNQFTRTPQP